jgi:photosystem II stability/assembly factor-like uncharacterized protein
MAAIAGTGHAQRPQVTSQLSGTHALLQSVSAVDENTVWIGGTGGTVLRTTDGGTTWQRRPVPGADRREFRGIAAVNSQDAWALSIGNGNASRIVHTTDGGATWTTQFINADSAAFYDCLTFFDARTGVAYSDASGGRTVVLRTTDGGAHWATLPADAVPAPLKGEGGFASSNSCAVSVDSKHGWIAAGEPGARVFRTGDAGKTWTLAASGLPVVHDSQAGITALSFRDAEHGVAVAGRVNAAMAHDTSAASVASTDDGGVTWTLRHRPPNPGLLSGVAMVSRAGANTLLVAGYGGLFLSNDLGDTWRALDANSYWAVRAVARRAWAVGPGGRITRVDF